MEKVKSNKKFTKMAEGGSLDDGRITAKSTVQDAVNRSKAPSAYRRSFTPPTPDMKTPGVPEVGMPRLQSQGPKRGSDVPLQNRKKKAEDKPMTDAELAAWNAKRGNKTSGKTGDREALVNKPKMKDGGILSMGALGGVASGAIKGLVPSLMEGKLGLGGGKSISLGGKSDKDKEAEDKKRKEDVSKTAPKAAKSASGDDNMKMKFGGSVGKKSKGNFRKFG